ncbi:MAG: phosphoglycerate dehydrogenase [Gammaproteobacteria bacterium]|nr:phosphoglycerate dehydrogenase [Gammaproteobacteria bacterium]MDX2486954.1 phosphoglycerate dehydrogenase [Gammaproteobacteria bacterium]
MHKILTLNNISPVGLEKLPKTLYNFGPDIENPEAIILRSYKMHDMEIPDSLMAVGRAGAGVNNIPVDKLTEMGIPVFNAPGANANAVKELVVAGLLLAFRNICEAWDYVRNLDSSDAAAMSKAVEEGKKRYAGYELPERTIGVVGLGAIGRSVANVCLSLGMKVVGYDPSLTVEGAWKLSSEIERANSLEVLLNKVDVVTFHVPLIEVTRNMINEERVALMKPGAVILNFARDGIVDDVAVVRALNAGRIQAYVCDFPSPELAGCEKVIALPHLGASTAEAEDNCAIMVANQLRDFIENGNITNSVNFPDVKMAKEAVNRLVVTHANIPNMLGQISTAMAENDINIRDMINQSHDEIAYTLVDTDSVIPDEAKKAVCAIDGVKKVRVV